MVPEEMIAGMARQVMDGELLSRPQADRLAALEPGRLGELLAGANAIREHFSGKTVRCCSIVSAKTGRCGEDCAFCSQSGHFKTHVQGLTVLKPEQVRQAALQAAGNGAESFGMVNSGYGPSDEEIEHWGRVLLAIRTAGRVRTCASMGVVSAEQARRLAELGVQRCNLNLQTSRRYFPRIIRTHTYDDRLQGLQALKAAGISICSGGLFGLGENWADRLDLAFQLRDLQVDVVPINFLIPIDGTPLAASEPMAVGECLKIIAVYRFCLPRQEIKVAGGRERSLGELQARMFQAGADSFLIGNYLTTGGRPAEEDHRMVSDLGLELQAYVDRPAGEAARPPGADPLSPPTRLKALGSTT